MAERPDIEAIRERATGWPKKWPKDSRIEERDLVGLLNYFDTMEARLKAATERCKHLLANGRFDPKDDQFIDDALTACYSDEALLDGTPEPISPDTFTVRYHDGTAITHEFGTPEPTNG